MTLEGILRIGELLQKPDFLGGPSDTVQDNFMGSQKQIFGLMSQIKKLHLNL